MIDATPPNAPVIGAMTEDELPRPSRPCPDGSPENPPTCSRCARPRYTIVPQFPKTAVCVCTPELPPTVAPVVPPPPPPPQPFALSPSDPTASYMLEIIACYMEGDAVGAFGWLFGLFNNHGSMRCDPEHTAPIREHAAALREYWVTMNPQGKGGF